jgi:WD40 repeat protein/transcriptional regulator with XRE-family HTH domain
MQTATLATAPESFATFGELLRYLRRRQHLTQLELSVAVGYSEAQITRLEKNQRLPDLTALKALFIPALGLEDDPRLAARLLELAETARQEDAPAPGLAPYKGLLFFDEFDADLFFGREALTAQLADRVAGVSGDRRFLAVVGASGSGKSSLMRAGLAVGLKRAGWEVRVFTPTADPLKMLEGQMGPLAANGKSLLVVDQFEETFTLCRSETTRAAFIEKLLALSAPLQLRPNVANLGGESPAGDAARRERGVTVVIALRADFYSHCAQYPTLRQAVAAEQEYIGQMTNQELRRAIEEPARQGGWTLEPGLVDALMRDVGAEGAEAPEPGALPLLSHALLATWERRRGKTLTLDGYHASGGVRGAIAETAENVFNDQLNNQQKELAHDIFLRLTELGEGTEDTRRRATLTELARQAEEGAALRAVLDTLADARLITLSEDSAEVAHEALIREWQRLHEWLTEDREGLRLHRHLTESSQEWERRGRDASELYRGARLAQAGEWADANQPRLNPAERAFLEASVEEEQREALEREVLRQRELEAAQRLAAERAQTAKRLRRRAYLLSGALVLALILAGVAVFFGQRAAISAQAAREQQQQAFARELAAAAINNLSVDPERSTLLALESARVSMQDGQDVLREAVDALQRSLQSMRLVKSWEAHDSDVFSIAISPDGKKLASISNDGTAKVWDSATGRLLQTLPTWNGIISGISIAFTPDGRYLLAPATELALKMWDISTGKEVRRFDETFDHRFRINSVAISPDGELVAGGGRALARIQIWDAATGRPVKFMAGSGTGTGNLVFARAKPLILSASGSDGKPSVWELGPRGYVGCAVCGDVPASMDNSIALSPDETIFALGGPDGTVTLFASSNAQRLLTLFGPSSSQIEALAFSRDGQMLASASNDGTTTIWEVPSGRKRVTLAGHSGGVLGVVFSPDGDRVYTASRDGTVKTWDISLAPGSTWLNIRHEASVFSAAYSPDGSRLATWSADGTARVWDASDGKELLRLPHESSESSGNAVFSPDGSRLAVVSGASTLIYDAATGELIRSLAPLPSTAALVLFSPDGSRLAASTRDGIVKISDSETGKNSVVFAGVFGGFISGMAFSPDGERIATATTRGTFVWDAATGEKSLSLEDDVAATGNGVAFSPDGRLLAGTGGDSRVRIWDAETGEQLDILAGFTAPTIGVAFSPDGGTLAASSTDRTVNVWRVPEAGEAFALPLTLYGHTGEVYSVAFSPDGAKLSTAGINPVVRTYPLDTENLIALARSRLTRGLTEQECQQFLHMETCPTEPAP